jgi:hypothetical protein
MKYRIVETGAGFVIQIKLLFWWTNLSYSPLYYAGDYLGWKYGPSRTDIWNTKDEAMKQLNFIRQYPFKYKGRTIHATNRYNDPVFYGFASFFSERTFKLVSENIGQLCEAIDKEEEEKLKSKRMSRILRIYDENGNQKNRQRDLPPSQT